MCHPTNQSKNSLERTEADVILQNRPRFILGLFLFLLTVSLQADVPIGYVDSQEIMAKFSEATDAMKKLDTENDKWAMELEKLNNDYKQKQQEMEEQSLLLSEAKKKERQQEIELLSKEIDQFQKSKWGENGEFFKRRESLLKPIFDKINAAISEVAQDRKLEYVFDTVQGNVLYSKEKYNLTEDVIELLEKDTDLLNKGN